MATILETAGMTREFRGFVAVNNVNLRVQEGTIHALIGPNGAGKTTCFNLLTKFLAPTRGTIRFEGRDITGLKPADVARLGLVRSFQISAVFPHLSALENVRLALQRARGGSFDFWRNDDALVADAVDLVRRHSRGDHLGGGDHGLRGDAAGHAHQLDRLGVLDLGGEELVGRGPVDVLGTLDARRHGATL